MQVTELSHAVIFCTANRHHCTVEKLRKVPIESTTILQIVKFLTPHSITWIYYMPNEKSILLRIDESLYRIQDNVHLGKDGSDAR